MVHLAPSFAEPRNLHSAPAPADSEMGLARVPPDKSNEVGGRMDQQFLRSEHRRNSSLADCPRRISWSAAVLAAVATAFAPWLLPRVRIFVGRAPGCNSVPGMRARAAGQGRAGDQ